MILVPTTSKATRGLTTAEIDAYVGARIRQRRIEVGLSQRQLAEILGITNVLVHKYERGLTRVHVGVFYEIARKLEVPIAYFYDGLPNHPRCHPMPHSSPQLETIIRQFAAPLDGRVRQVEPAAFTKVSALGVEEQRTYIVIDLVSPQSEWSTLGDGYRVDARIIVYQAENVLKVPTGALFRDRDQWTVYVAANGIARKRMVTLSRRTGLEAMVAGGLAENEQVVLFPSDAISDGVRVAAR